MLVADAVIPMAKPLKDQSLHFRRDPWAGVLDVEPQVAVDTLDEQPYTPCAGELRGYWGR